MASTIPSLTLHSNLKNCCHNNEKARVVYNTKKNRFETKNITVTCCSGWNSSKTQQATLEALGKTFSEKFKVSLESLASEQQIDIKKDKITPKLFNNLVERAQKKRQQQVMQSYNLDIQTPVHLVFNNNEIQVLPPKDLSQHVICELKELNISPKLRNEITDEINSRKLNSEFDISPKLSNKIAGEISNKKLNTDRNLGDQKGLSLIVFDTDEK